MAAEVRISGGSYCFDSDGTVDGRGGTASAAGRGLEPLEPRLLLSGTVYVIDSLSDVVAHDGQLTLCEAIEAANQNAWFYDAPAGSGIEADEIAFDPALAGGTLTLNQMLAVRDDLVVDGSDAPGLVLTAAGGDPVFRVEQGSLGLGYLTLAGCVGGEPAVEVGEGASLSVWGCTFRDNESESTASAILANHADVEILNSTFTRNGVRGRNDGAVVEVTGSDADLYVANSTFAHNQLEAPGAVLSVGSDVTVTVSNSIFADSNRELIYGSSEISGDFNLLDSDAGNWAPGQGLNNTIAPADLAALGFAGGPTEVMPLQAGSAALDGGSNALATDASGAALPWDQRGEGFGRISGFLVDIGAHESAGPVIVTDRADLSILEGGHQRLGVWLSEDPGTDVTLTVSTVGDGRIAPDVDTLVFTPENWDRPHHVTFTAEVNDEAGPLSADVELSVTGLPARTIAAEALQRQVYVVDTLLDVDDSGDGMLSLREALKAANQDTSYPEAPMGRTDRADLIVFDPALAGGRLLLDQGELVVRDDLELIGLGADRLTLDGGGQSRLLKAEGTADLFVEGLTLTGGSGPDAGTAIWTHSNGMLSLLGVTVEGNEGASRPTILAGHDLRIERSALVGNLGGAVVLANGQDATVEIRNSTIAENHQEVGYSFPPGAVSLPYGGLIESCTITGNTRGLTGDQVALHNTIIAGNLGGGGLSFNADLTVSMAWGDYNLIGNNSGVDWEDGEGEHNLTGSGGEPLDALLGRLGYAGGPTPVALPEAGSPAIGAAGGGTGVWAWDQRGEGFARQVGPASDIGAYEADGLQIVTSEAAASGLEGEQFSVLVWLSRQPTAEVTVSVTPAGGDASVTLLDSELTFTPENWQVPQRVAFDVAIDADSADGLATFELSAPGLAGRTLTVAALERQVYVVDTLADADDNGDGVLSLREAIRAANQETDYPEAPRGRTDRADLITFDPALAGGTIVLAGNEFHVTDDLVILGPGADQLTLDADRGSSLFHLADEASLLLEGLTLAHGYTSNRGGAIEAEDGTTLHVRRCALIDNEAAYGGAIAGARITIEGSALIGNYATAEGGAIFSDKNAPITIVNSTLAGNTANDRAAIEADHAEVSIYSSTIVGNQTRSEDVPVLAETLRLYNSLFHGNEDSAGRDRFAGANTLAGDYNFIANNDGAVWEEGTGAHNLAGSAESPLDPALNDHLYYHDGIGAYVPGSDSPVVDAASPWPTDGAALLTADAIGQARVIGPASDMGAAEYDPAVQYFNVQLSHDAIVMPAGATRSVWVQLTGAPDGEVRYDLTAEAEWLRPADGEVVFTPTDWDRPQLLTFTALGSAAVGSAPLQLRQDGLARATIDVQIVEPIVVDTMLDVVDGGDGWVSLREAIEAANTNAAYNEAPAGSDERPDCIVFAPECFGEVMTVLDLEPLGDGPEFQLTDDVAFYAPGGGLVTLSGDGEQALFTVAENVYADFIGLTLQNAYAGSSQGPAIANHGHAWLEDMTFQDNASGGDGGAVMNDADMLIAASRFLGNQAAGGGGAVYSQDASLLVLDSTFEGNVAEGLFPSAGGAVSARGGQLGISRSTFSGNRFEAGAGTSGGGGAVGTLVNDTTIAECVFENNSVVGWGGGLWMKNFASSPSEPLDRQAVVRIDDSIIRGNRAAGGGSQSRGGGLAVLGGTFDMSNSLLADNTAYLGSAARLVNQVWDIVFPHSLNQVTIAGNHATASGGPTTIHANSLDELFAAGEGNLLISGNTKHVDVLGGEGGRAPDNPGEGVEGVLSVEDAGFLAGGDDGGDGWGDDPLTWADESANDVYGDYRLAGGSPAIDAGSAAAAVNTLGVPLAADLAGEARTVGGAVDMGAYEHAYGTTYIIDTLDDIVAADGLLSLREALQAANTNQAVNEAPAGSGTLSDCIRFSADLLAAGPVVLVVGSQLSVTDDLAVLGPGMDSLAVSGRDQTKLFAVSAGVTAVFEDLHLTHGDPGTAGAIDNHQGDVTIRRVKFTENFALNGGAVGNHSGTMLIEDSLFENNTAQYHGGAVYSEFSTLTVSRTAFVGNRAGTSSDSTGGAICMPSGDLYISDCTFLNNATAGKGGAIYATMVDLLQPNRMTVDGSVFQGNRAVYGPGALHASGGLFEMSQSLVAANQSQYGAGGLYLNNTVGSGAYRLIQSTIAHNVASDGVVGGVKANGYAGFVANTIVAHNRRAGSLSGWAGTGWDGQLLMTPSVHFIQAPDDGGDGFGDDPGTPADESANDVHGNYALLATSEGIDAGDDDQAVDTAGGLLTADLAGRPRRLGEGVDFGAYEHDSIFPCIHRAIAYADPDQPGRKVLAWYATDNVGIAAQRYSLNGGGWVNVSGNWASLVLVVGDFVDIEVQDAAGNLAAYRYSGPYHPSETAWRAGIDLDLGEGFDPTGVLIDRNGDDTPDVLADRSLALTHDLDEPGVTVVGTQTAPAITATVDIGKTQPGEWFHAVFADPFAGQYRLVGVETYDGRPISESNWWLSPDGQGVHLVDDPSQRYLLTYELYPEVIAEHVFYSGSAFDANGTAAGWEDDAAIATDKQALRPGQAADFANYTSYSRGINGLMVDLAGSDATATVADFAFAVGNSNDPGTWAAAPAPTVTVRPGAGIDGSDRVTLTWADNAIQKQWLEVTVLADANGGSLGLREDHVFYFGNAVGECGDSPTNALVNAADEIAARNNPAFFPPATVTNRYDFNRDKLVNATDQIIARNNGTFFDALRLIQPVMPAPLDGSSAEGTVTVSGRTADAEAAPADSEPLIGQTSEPTAAVGVASADFNETSPAAVVDPPATTVSSPLWPVGASADADDTSGLVAAEDGGAGGWAPTADGLTGYAAPSAEGAEPATVDVASAPAAGDDPATAPADEASAAGSELETDLLAAMDVLEVPLS